MTPTSTCVAACALSVAAAVCGARQLPAPHAHHHLPAAEQLTRTTATYRLEGLSLLRSDGTAVTLAAELDHDGPLVLDFVFTTCTTICPILSRTFAELQLASDPARRLRLVSISIDPQHDTPTVLRSYAQQFEAGKNWRFYTGTVAQSIAVQRAFDVYRGNKMNHVPLTFVRRARGEPWVRLEGYASAGALARELAP